jgi:hypothetical protein
MMPTSTSLMGADRDFFSESCAKTTFVGGHAYASKKQRMCTLYFMLLPPSYDRAGLFDADHYSHLVKAVPEGWLLPWILE